MNPTVGTSHKPTPSSLLFSYGTLQQGERAEYHLEDANYLGEVSTVEPFLLVDCGEFPGLVAEPGHPDSARVIGELYRIPEHLWPKLDCYEGIEEGDYSRSQIQVIDTDHREIRVEAYVWAREWKHLPVVGSSWKPYRQRYYPLD